MQGIQASRWLARSESVCRVAFSKRRIDLRFFSEAGPVNFTRYATFTVSRSFKDQQHSQRPD